MIRNHIFFFLLLGLLFSCKKYEDEIGLENPTDFVGVQQLEFNNIKSYTALDNRFQTSDNANYALVGAYNDNYLGLVQANHYTQLRMINTQPNFGTNFVCDSAVLFLEYARFSNKENHSYGDTLQAMPISVWELDESFLAATDYKYKTTDALQAAQKIGETSLDLVHTPNTSIRLSIPIDAAAGQRILNAAYQNGNSAFLEEFKGIKITANEGYAGAVLGFENTSSNTRLVVYYHNDNTSGSFSIYSYNATRRFNQFVSAYTTTDFESIQEIGDTLNSTLTNNLLAIQSGTGLGAFIQFPELNTFLDTVGTISIIKAELIISVEDASITGFTDAPNALLIAYQAENGTLKAENNEPIKINNDNYYTQGGTTLFSYNKEKKQYSLPLTNHFESFAKGKITSSDIFLQGQLKETRVHRSILLNEKNGTNPMRLEFYYSKLK